MRHPAHVGSNFAFSDEYRDSSLADPRRHAAYQAFETVSRLQEVPNLKREHYILNGPMSEVDRLGRQVRSLRLSPAEAAEREIDAIEFMKRLRDHSRRLEQTQTAFHRLHERRGVDLPRARSIGRRNPAERGTRERRS
jgi:hypothetical protein